MKRIRIIEFDNIILLVLFLCGMNFQAKFFYFAFGLFILQCLTKRYLHCDRMFWVYLLFSAVYCIYGLSAGTMEVVRRLAFLCMYMVGYDSTMVHTNSSNDDEGIETWIIKCVLVFSIGAFFHYFLNMMTNIGSSIGRNTLDVWSGEILSATGQAALVCPMVGVAVARIIAPQTNKKRIIPIIAVLIILLYNTMLAGRTLIVMLLLDALFCIILYSVYEDNMNRKLKTWAALIVIIILALILYQMNAFGVRTMFEQSNLYARFFGVTTANDLTEDSRMFRKQYYLSHMWNYWWGGQHMNAQVGFAHDLLLDCYDEAGILAVIPLLIVVISSVNNVVRIARIHCFSNQNTILILSFYFCIFIQFFMEPILVGTRWLFAGYCLVNGCLNAVLKSRQIDGCIEVGNSNE